MVTTKELINKATIETGEIANGLLSPEQASKFLQMTFEATSLGKLVRHVMRKSRSGEVDKIGIAKRILREKVENVDDGYRASVNTGVLKYATTATRLPWEITEEALRENIEGANFENIVTNLMTTQLGLDAEDLYLNGDVDTDSGDEDYDFLKINDGWIKQITNGVDGGDGGHIIDASGESEMSLDLFYDAVQAMPNKYNNGKLKWLMSPHRAQQWELFLLNKVIGQGGAVPDSVYNSPVGIPVVQCPALDDSRIILTDPQNLIVVNTYNMQIRKTTEGMHAIMEDKRFYVIHFDFDPIIEELDAVAMISGLA